jgi:hypothetical protein
MFFSGVRVVRSLDFCVVFVDHYTNCKVFRLTQAHTFTPLMQLRSNAHIKQTLLHKVYNFLTLQNSIYK